MLEHFSAAVIENYSTNESAKSKCRITALWNRICFDISCDCLGVV